MGPFTHMWEDLYWIDVLSLLVVRLYRPWDRIDAVWFLLRLTCRPVDAAAASVLVMGGSVTGGGGVGNDPSRVWHALLGSVRPTVHHKNAIDPSYFLHCTERFVDHGNYSVALFDLGANMFDATCEQSLVDLVARVRCLSNAPSVGLINWPGPLRNNSDTRAAARRARATLIEVPHGPDLYAADRVHPNALGHARIAERVRKYLARPPLRDTVYAEDCPGVRDETCFSTATEMPVVTRPPPRDWSLVDDSPIPERVHKTAGPRAPTAQRCRSSCRSMRRAAPSSRSPSSRPTRPGRSC